MSYVVVYYTAQKMKFPIMDLFGKCDLIRSFLRIWLHLLKKSLMENFIFCAVFAVFSVVEHLNFYHTVQFRKLHDNKN